MKNFRKIAMLIVALLVAMSMLFVLASCGGDETTDVSSNSDQSGADSQGADGTTDSSTDDSTSDSGATDNSSNDNGNTDNSSTDSSNNGGSSNNSSHIGPSSNSGSSSGNGGTTPDNPPVDNPNLVTVTVVNQLGKPVKNAVIQICQGETCFFKPIETGANGVGSREYSLSDETLKAKIISIDGMDDFVATNGYVYFDEGSRELTITVQKVIVNVYDDNENGIEGAVVQLYQGEEKLENTIITDANGEAYAFVALSGNTIGAKVTEILSGSGYVIENKVTEFGDGEYTGTVIVEKNSSYNVRISDLFGMPAVGVKVKLYSGDIFEDVATTNENGVAIFENLTGGEYSVEVIFTSPAYQVLGGEDNGRHYFADSKTLEISFIELSEIEYTVTVVGGSAGDVIDVLDVDNQVITAVEVDENGVASFYAPNGYYTVVLRTEGAYAAPAFFVRDGAATGKITVTSRAAGSDLDAPIFIVGEATVSLEAGKTVWFAVPNANQKTVKFSSVNGISMNVSGDVYEGDAIIQPFTFYGNKGEYRVFGITSAEAQELTVTTGAPGTENDPIDLSGKLSMDSFLQNVILTDGSYTYFTYTATESGVIKVVVNGANVYYNYFDMGIEADGYYVYPVAAGDTVIITINGYESATVGAEFYFGNFTTDYTVYVTKDGEACEGIVAILYLKDSEGNLTEVARATANEFGECVFEDVVCSAYYVVKVEEIPAGYEALYEELELMTYNYASYILSVIKTGEPDAPFEFDTYDQLMEEVYVPENGSVWYTLYVRPSMGSKYYLVVNADNVVIKVYNSDTNDDGIIDENDEPVGVATSANGICTYVFTANDMYYTFAVSTADGSAASFELAYASEELDAGTTVENAIEITEAGAYTANVNDVLYYVYAGNDECKLTITVTGDATLKVIHRSMDGFTVEDVENNTYTVDTEGTWIYFAIFAENAGEYEFTVTVE